MKKPSEELVVSALRAIEEALDFYIWNNPPRGLCISIRKYWGFL